MKPGKKRVAWILYQLRKRGLSGAEIARRAGVGRPCVSMVMSGMRKGQKVREEIAKALNKEVGKIFKEA